MEAKRVPVDVPQPPDDIVVTMTQEGAGRLRRFLSNAYYDSPKWAGADEAKKLDYVLYRAGVSVTW